MKLLKLVSVFLILLVGIKSIYSQVTESNETLTNQAKVTVALLDNNISLRDKVTKVTSSGVVYFKENVPLNEIEKVINTNSEITYKLVTERKSKKDNSLIIRRFQQYYKGIRVEGSQYTIHSKIDNFKKEEFVKMLAPHLKNEFTIDTKSKITLKSLPEIIGVTKINHHELIITNKFENNYKLVWEVRYFSKGLKLGWIDAHSGKVLGSQSGYYDVGTYITSDANSGVKKSATKNNSNDIGFLGAFSMIDINGPTEDYGVQVMNSRNNGENIELASEDNLVRTYDFNQTNVYTIDPVDFVQNLIPILPVNQDVWTTNEADESVYQAHWMVHNSILTYANIGIEYNLIHVGSNAAPDQFWGPNAFALNGSTLNEGFILFSDLDNGSTLAEYDIVGHELAHVYLFEFLNYNSAGNASLHEGISDMLGVFIESVQQGLDWQLGEDASLIIRDLENPDFGCFTDVQNFPFQGFPNNQHNRSQPLGHWFHLAVAGSTSNNDIIALGINTMIDIITGSLEILNNMNADYPQFRTATLDFVEDEFGKCSQEYRTLVAAWDEICVTGASETCQCNTYATPLLTTNLVSLTCPANSIDLNQFFNGTIPQGASLIWSTDNDPSDGVNPILSNIVSTSETYYAYFQNTVENCFSDPSIALLVTIQAQHPDLNINTNTYYTGINYFGGNIIVNNGATLHIHLADVTFFLNKGIIVKNGGRLILQGSTIDVCNISQSWAGIKIESGGFLDTDDAILINADNGVNAKNNSTLQINNLTITGKNNLNLTGIGLSLEGNVNTDFIYNLIINNYNIGIKAGTRNISGNLYEFNHGLIDNTNYGISALNTPLILNDIGIQNTLYGVNLQSSPSYINESVIIYKEQGISAISSPHTKVEDCNIFNQYDTDNNSPAIHLTLSDGCRIINNPTISSAVDAISIWGSSKTEVSGNFIETIFPTNNPTSGGPVNLNNGINNVITNNYIEATNSEYGINTVMNTNTAIDNNNIIASSYNRFERTASIKSTGSSDENITENIIESLNFATSVQVQNTDGNEYFCNQITSSDIGLEVLHNSEMQRIAANSFDALTLDLSIKSEIGPQAKYENDILIKNYGNLFIGGNAIADENELTFDQISNSRFTVNPIYTFHKPSAPTPSVGWFINNNLTSYENCGGGIGPDWIMFNNDPTKICQYWTWLKSIRTTKPEQFFVKLYHLLKYAKTKQGFNLPNCVKLDPVLLSVCGMSKVVDVSVALTKVSNSTLDGSGINSLQSQYKSESRDAGKAAVKDQMAIEMAQLMPQLVQENISDSIKLDSLNHELSLINCTTTIVTKWKEILKMYIKYVRTGKVQESDKAALESYSSDCADLYGDVIHLARAMVNTYDNTYYDLHDVCLDRREEPRLQSGTEVENIRLAPNPTSGIININLPSDFIGSLMVYDATGRQVISKELEKITFTSIDISNQIEGLYFIKFFSEKNGESVFKTILIK